MTFEMLEYAA